MKIVTSPLKRSWFGERGVSRLVKTIDVFLVGFSVQFLPLNSVRRERRLTGK